MGEFVGEIVTSNTTPRIESIQDILDRGYSNSGILFLMYFPTREIRGIHIKNGKPVDPNISMTARVYIFRASFP